MMTGDRPAATDVNAVIDAHERSAYRLAVGVSRRSCSTWATVTQWCACTACRRRRSYIASSLSNWPQAFSSACVALKLLFGRAKTVGG
jgi:hypothetical protein